MKNILAAFIFFTRLPLWKVFNLPGECFKRVVEWWPLVGWLTGGVMAGVFYLASQCLPIYLAIILALLARVLLTGALHEDGFADFCDGFGSGGGRERILAIMKDSHIGTYGVIGLIFYYLTMVATMASLPADILPLIMIAADAGSKMFAAQIINVLPYCRKAEEAKNKTVYDRMPVRGWLAALAAGIAPAFLLPFSLWTAYAAPLVVSLSLFALMRRKIAGYTGDCCGAAFILSELSFYLVCCIIL